MPDNHIVIVEDEEKIAKVLQEYLQQDGFEVTVLHEGTMAVETIVEKKPALVILDIMLPGKDGLTICRELRQVSMVPILMVTARIDEIDRLLGLEMGADDYVCKPFLPREIVARVRAILRRVQQNPATQIEQHLEYKGISLSPDRFQCEIGGVELELTPVEFRMLQTMMTQPGRVHYRQSLKQVCYLDDRIVSDRTIDSHIKNLRKKLTVHVDNDEIIHSIYGVGYKME
jgi:two-component system response regulator BaeR